MKMTTVTKDMMLRYLQMQMDAFKKDEERYGMSDYLEHKLDAMIACKEMVETLIGEPVNLQQDGKVTVGLY